MKQIKTEIIAVGTELLLGQIANTNAQWISQQLASFGIDVYFHSVVGDNLKRVQDQFTQASKRSNVIIITGGLGPTEDDLTREAFQNLTNLDIVEHQPSMESIKAFFKKNEREMTPNNRRQARVFSESIVIDNTVGMAPGMIVKHNEKTWIFLPGVPREMKQMMTDHVLPHLRKIAGENSVIQSTMMMFTGIGESRLEHELKDMIHNQVNPTIAPLAQSEGVAIRVTAKARTKEEADRMINKIKEDIISKVGSFFIGENQESLAEAVFAMLKKKNKKLAAAESLTGGMFTETLVSFEGASKVCPGGVVCYDEKVKQYLLKVSPETIQNKGTVSEACALEMAANICDVLDADIGIAFTGVAGPDMIEGQAVGTVYIAIGEKNGRSIAEQHFFSGNRHSIRQKAVIKGFELLFHFLKS